MKKIMWIFALTAGLMTGLAAAAPKGWETDFAAAKKAATEKKRPDPVASGSAQGE